MFAVLPSPNFNATSHPISKKYGCDAPCVFWVEKVDPSAGKSWNIGKGFASAWIFTSLWQGATYCSKLSICEMRKNCVFPCLYHFLSLLQIFSTPKIKIDLSDYQLSGEANPWIFADSKTGYLRPGQIVDWKITEIEGSSFEGFKHGRLNRGKKKSPTWNFKSNQLIFPWMQAVSETTPVIGDLEISN